MIGSAMSKASPVQPASFADEAAEADTSIAADPIDNYSLSGELVNFWGINGLNAKLDFNQVDGAMREKVNWLG